MFVLNEQERGIRPSEEKTVVGILHSINEPKIAAAERPAEPTRAYICTLERAPGRFDVRVFLFLTRSRVRVVYSPEEGTADPKGKKDREAEALDFVEGMGFMMDNLNLGKLGAEERRTSLAELPIFDKPAPERVLDQVLEAEAELEASLGRQDEAEIPIVSRARSKSPVPGAETAGDLTLEDLEAEFRREEIGIGDVDSALDSVFGPSEKRMKRVEGTAGAVPDLAEGSKWRTIVRFLASF